jgi:TonB family protein
VISPVFRGGYAARGATTVTATSLFILKSAPLAFSRRWPAGGRFSLFLRLLTLMSIGVGCVSSAQVVPLRSAGAFGATGAEKEWSRRLRKQVLAHWNPWDVVESGSSPDSRSGHLTTVLHMAIHRDGQADAIRVSSGSGDAHLDADAVASVEAAEPLPPPPRDLFRGTDALGFDLGFRVYVGQQQPRPEEDEKLDRFPVIFAAPDSTPPGHLDRSAIASVVNAHMPEAQRCSSSVQQEVVGQPTRRMTLRFVISPTGNVANPVVISSEGIDRAFENCFVETILKWAFPAPQGGHVVVSYPFDFTPQLTREGGPAQAQAQGAADARHLQGDDPIEVFKGRIIIVAKGLPSAFSSAGEFTAALRKFQIGQVPTIDRGSSGDKRWHLEFVAFFAEPFDEPEVALRVFDVSGGGKKHIASDLQYTREKGARMFTSSIDLAAPAFEIGRLYLMTLESHGHVLASTTFWLVPKG